MTKEEKAAKLVAEVEAKRIADELTAKVELTVAKLVVLINNSKKVELPAEQVAGCKNAMVTICQKFVTGEKITADENTIMQFVAGLTKKAVHAGQTEAEKAEAKKQAEKTFAADVQKYEIQVAVDFQLWSANLVKANLVMNEIITDGSLNFVKLSKDALKVSFAEFIKGLPTEPKKPGATKREGSEKSTHEGPSAHSLILSCLKEGAKNSEQILACLSEKNCSASLTSQKWVLARVVKDGKIELKNGIYTIVKVAQEIVA